MSEPEKRIEYYDNGNILYEEYILNEKLHRLDGPARIYYYQNGNICVISYYINGVALTEEKWYNTLSAEDKVHLVYGVDNE